MSYNRPPATQQQNGHTPPKGTWGGARCGRGAHKPPTIQLRITVTRESYQKLLRLANGKGLKRTPGASIPFFGSVIDELLLAIATIEPEYIRLAREIREAAPPV